MRYRREIDGLRAVAVLPVILFHAGFDAFAGGYVGVDVFFVISGYLITSIILDDLEHGRFSLRYFYERRARRILPALFLVMLCCVPFAWMWMVPQQFEAFALALVAVSLFASNILFWQTTGYFEPRGEENPLLHTWSLAIEEQFYIGFPILLLLLWRFGRSPVFWVVVALSAFSLLLAEYGSRFHPVPNFYLLPTRAWELGAGAICAFLMYGRVQRESTLLSTAGLALIVFAILAFDGETPFPSLYALAPVGGTALVILYGGPSTLAARLLSTPILVGIGLISYSAYLWHQPLFAFARIRSLAYPAPELMLFLAVVSLGLAYLSWRYVELPFRRRPVPTLPSQAALFGASGAAAGLFVAFGLYGSLSEGRRALWVAQNPDRAHVYTLYEEAASISGRFLDDGACRFNIRYWDERAADRMRACADEHGPGLAVIGDSHGVDLFNGMYVAAPAEFLVGVTSNCRPPTPRPECPYEDFASFVADAPEVFATVLYTEAGYRMVETASGIRGREVFQRLPEAVAIDVEQHAVLKAEARQAAHYLDGLAERVEVIWLGPRIEPHISLNFILSAGCEHEYELRPGLRELFLRVDERLEAMSRGFGYTYVSQIEKTGFDIATDFITCDELYWRDGDHWSLAGAGMFVERLLSRPPFSANQPWQGAS